MASKLFHIPDVGQVVLHKRKGTRSMRLTITHEGVVRVTMPPWAPYRLGVEFAKAKSEWIISKQKPQVILENGDVIGKSHVISVTLAADLQKPLVRVNATYINLRLPATMPISDPLVQNELSKAAIRALKRQAEQILPQRLRALSETYNLPFKSLTIKRLKSRWGSCNEQKNIVLNCYLMQLPWELIDYVMLHELTHTKVMSHGKPFWTQMQTYIDDVAWYRKAIKQYHPSLIPIKQTSDYSSSGSRQIQVA